MTGNATPETEKAAPVGVAAVIVTGAVPADVRVTDWVAAVFSVTSPKATPVELIFRVDTYAFSCKAKFSDAPFALAERVTNREVATDDTFAVN